MSAPTTTEAQLRATYERHRALHEAGNWIGLADLFTEDAAYLDSVYGWSHGRDAIRTFLERSMTGLEDWSFPILAVAFDPGASAVLNHWMNRLPGVRPDGTHYDVPGASIISVTADGLISRQMDLFDTALMRRTIEEWSADHDGALPHPS